MWDLIVSVPDHCLSFYSASMHLGLFSQLSIRHERSCKILCLNYFKPVTKTEYSTSQTQVAQWVRRRGSFKIVFFANMQHYTGKL